MRKQKHHKNGKRKIDYSEIKPISKGTLNNVRRGANAAMRDLSGRIGDINDEIDLLVYKLKKMSQKAAVGAEAYDEKLARALDTKKKRLEKTRGSLVSQKRQAAESIRVAELGYQKYLDEKRSRQQQNTLHPINV
jgi:hypothetical protein